MNQIELLTLHNKMVEHKLYLKRKFTEGVINKLNDHQDVQNQFVIALNTSLDTCTIKDMEENPNALVLLSATVIEAIQQVVKNNPGIQI